MTGTGTYKWTDGRCYVGTWKENSMHGKGIYTWIDGRKYDGEYKDDQKEGYGVYTYNNSKKYFGTWKSGKQDGEGMVLKDGRERKGIWENGKRTKWTDGSPETARAGERSPSPTAERR